MTDDFDPFHIYEPVLQHRVVGALLASAFALTVVAIAVLVGVDPFLIVFLVGWALILVLGVFGIIKP